MIPRSFLLGLLLGVAILLVSFAVVMGGYGLAAGMGDATAASVFWYFGMAIVSLLAISLILLIVAITLVVLGFERRESIGEEIDAER